MQIYPEITLVGDKIVYPHGTDFYQPILNIPNPLHLAVRWKNLGARWLHIQYSPTADSNTAYLISLIQQLTSMGLAIQVSTSIADIDKLAELSQAGASRIFISAQLDSEIIADTLKKYGAEAVGIAFYSKPDSSGNLAQGLDFYKRGGRYALCTDTARVGTLSGIDLPRLNDFAIATQLDLLSKGGVAHIHDLLKLKATRQVAGVVLGRALYDRRIDLAEALTLAK